MTQRTNFTMIPNEALDDMRLDPYDRAALQEIFRYDKIWKGKETLAKACNMSRQRFDKSWSKLIETGWLTHDGKNFHFNWDNEPLLARAEPLLELPLPVRADNNEPLLLRAEPLLEHTDTAPSKSGTALDKSETAPKTDAYNNKENIIENTITNNASDFPYPSFSFLLKDLEKARDRHLRRKAFLLDFHYLFTNQNLLVPEGRPDSVWCGEFDNACRKLNLTKELSNWTSDLEREIDKKETEERNRKNESPFFH